MLRVLAIIVTGCVLLGIELAYAQEPPSQNDEPVAAEAPPELEDAEKEAEPIIEEPPVVEISAADLLAPGLKAQLEALWGPVATGEPSVYNNDNLTVLTVPTGYSVYIAPISDVRAAEAAAQDDVQVEDIVFTEQYLVGTAPITVSLEPNEYVLAIAANTRQKGFDGNCVRKTTLDVITMGPRYPYHLYLVQKERDQYQTFVASFIGPDTTREELGEDIYARGTFWIDEDLLAEDLELETNVPAEKRKTVAAELNALGISFYRTGGQDYLVKLTQYGASYLIEEWLVE